MMIGEPPRRSIPTVQVPPWDFFDDHPSAGIHSPFSLTPRGNAVNFNDLPLETLTALHRYLPSNTDGGEGVVVPDHDDLDIDIPVDAFSCDEFRIYEFKVRKCARARSHDWTECPYAHPGEKARRRDPRKYHYSGNACPDFRKGGCSKGDSCEYAHGVFECWLHPARYRTQPCKDGTHCRRRVCFFAHTTDQLRILPPSYEQPFEGSPARNCRPRLPVKWAVGSSPTSVLNFSGSSSPPDSPPMSPSGGLGLNSVSYLADSMRNLQIGYRRMDLSLPSWGPVPIRPGFMSQPCTPTRIPTRIGAGVFDNWDASGQEEEPIMERVESGKDLRARIYAKLSMENSMDSSGPGPDFGWVSELVK